MPLHPFSLCLSFPLSVLQCVSREFIIADRQTHTHIQTDTHTQTHTHTDRQTHTQTETHTDRHTQTDRHTHTHTHRPVSWFDPSTSHLSGSLNSSGGLLTVVWCLRFLCLILKSMSLLSSVSCTSCPCGYLPWSWLVPPVWLLAPPSLCPPVPGSPVSLFCVILLF